MRQLQSKRDRWVHRARFPGRKVRALKSRRGWQRTTDGSKGRSCSVPLVSSLGRLCKHNPRNCLDSFVRVNPLRLRLVPEPGELALGVLPRTEFHQCNCLVEAMLTFQMFEDLAVPQRLPRPRAVGQAPGFLNEAAGEHGLNAEVDTAMQIGSITLQDEKHGGRWR